MLEDKRILKEIKMDTDKILEKLKSGQAKHLIYLATNFLFQQPIRKLFPHSFVESQVKLILESIVQGEQTKIWVTEQVELLRQQVPEGYPKDFIPKEVVAPWRELLKHEMVFNEKLVHHLIDHRAIEQLFHEILTDVLTEFTKTMKNWGDMASSSTPKGVNRGFGRLKALGERALKETPLGNLTQMIETQAQKKIMEYLDLSITKVLRMTAIHISAEENRSMQAAYRVHILDVLLSTRNEVLMEQIEVIEPRYLVDAITETIRGFLERDSFQDEIHQLVTSGMESFGEKSLFDVMEEAGLSDEWRVDTEDHLTSLVLLFLETDEAGTWLKNLLA